MALFHFPYPHPSFFLHLLVAGPRLQRCTTTVRFPNAISFYLGFWNYCGPLWQLPIIAWKGKSRVTLGPLASCLSGACFLGWAGQWGQLPRCLKQAAGVLSPVYRKQRTHASPGICQDPVEVAQKSYVVYKLSTAVTLRYWWKAVWSMRPQVGLGLGGVARHTGGADSHNSFQNIGSIRPQPEHGPQSGFSLPPSPRQRPIGLGLYNPRQKVKRN